MAKLTTKAVEAIQPGTARQEIPDALLPGLYLVVQPSGARSWACRYRHNGKPRKHTLGPYPAIDLKAARELGAKALRAAAEGRDPGREKAQARAAEPVPDTVDAIIAQFLERHGKRNLRARTLQEATRVLCRHVLPQWRGRAITSITRRDVRDLTDKIVDAGAPILANRTFSLVRKFFNYCVEHEIIAVSPCAGMKRPIAESARDRVLTDDELSAVWRAAEAMGWPFGPVVQLAMLTGQRLGEVAGMEWAELDLANRLWRLPKERTKNNRPHDVPLSAQAVAIIEAVPKTSERFVFSTNGTVAASNFGKNKRRLDALLPPAMPPWVIHDLRRTCATGLARLGIALPVIEKSLNHVSGSFAGIVGIYQRHEFSAEKAEALQRWADHVTGIVTTDRPAKVVPMVIRGKR